MNIPAAHHPIVSASAIVRHQLAAGRSTNIRPGAIVAALMFSVTGNGYAQTAVPVFKCEVEGRVVWSDQPCKGRGKIVKVKSPNPKGSDKASDNKNPPAQSVSK